MYRYYYTEDGTITKSLEHNHMIQLPEDGLWVDSETFYDVNRHRYVDGSFIEYTPIKQERPLLWYNKRIQKYGSAEQQLNLLYDDIKNGKFGEDAKTSSWYLHVKAVKDEVAKD